VEALLGELKAVEEAPAVTAKHIINAFTDGEGPQILHEIESSMRGDWITDAKNGTLSQVSQIFRLPGRVGLAAARYRCMAQQRVHEAAAHVHVNCSHDVVSVRPENERK